MRWAHHTNNHTTIDHTARWGSLLPLITQPGSFSSLGRHRPPLITQPGGLSNTHNTIYTYIDICALPHVLTLTTIDHTARWSHSHMHIITISWDARNTLLSCMQVHLSHFHSHLSPSGISHSHFSSHVAYHHIINTHLHNMFTYTSIHHMHARIHLMHVSFSFHISHSMMHKSQYNHHSHSYASYSNMHVIITISIILAHSTSIIACIDHSSSINLSLMCVVVV